MKLYDIFELIENHFDWWFAGESLYLLKDGKVFFTDFSEVEDISKKDFKKWLDKVEECSGDVADLMLDAAELRQKLAKANETIGKMAEHSSGPINPTEWKNI